MATLTTEVKKSAAIVLSSNQQQPGLASTAFGPSQSFSDRTLPSTLIQNKPPEVKVGSAGQTDNISLLKSTTDLRFAPTISSLGKPAQSAGYYSEVHSIKLVSLAANQAIYDSYTWS
jgi:hypothetical protein